MIGKSSEYLFNYTLFSILNVGEIELKDMYLRYSLNSIGTGIVSRTKNDNLGKSFRNTVSYSIIKKPNPCNKSILMTRKLVLVTILHLAHLFRRHPDEDREQFRIDKSYGIRVVADPLVGV